MGLFSKKIGPVFLKESSDTTQFIQRMEELLPTLSGDLKREIEKQLKLARYGEFGENNIAFELQNSGMDMYILRDIYLEIDGLSAQIDYMVFTRKCIYVLECKNLIGNIEIDNGGNFIRSYELFGKRVKEGFYSPITQNQRHMEVIKKLRSESKSNFVTKFLFEKWFGDSYKSLVVLANPKTYLNAKYAKKEVKDKVIRADQLIAYMKKHNTQSEEANMSEDDMFKIAMFFLEKNKSERSDYARKYEELAAEARRRTSASKQEGVSEKTAKSLENLRKELEEPIKNEAELSKMAHEQKTYELKAFRLQRSREEKIKPYYIFNDAQMMDLLEKNPQDKEALLRVAGFGPVKVEKYGDEILRILESTK